MKVTRESFTTTYDKYKNTVYSVIFNYVRNSEDASDVTQDVFLKLLDCDTEFTDDEHLKAWLIRVAINSSKNLLKFRNRFSDEEVPEMPYFDEHNEDSEILQALIKLPEKYRIPLHLFYYEDYSIKQIGDVLGAPEATIKIRLKRGREKLKKLLN
ncbi:MAG: sigma-70 family RNA polymerase sigma factor [Saccharofermentans sp.]|nr:sigma-70 family RNA polymerase sigma factor [Saccharofermentans sp.]